MTRRSDYHLDAEGEGLSYALRAICVAGFLLALAGLWLSASALYDRTMPTMEATR